MAITRANIRRTVARMLNDYYEAEDAAGGQTGQFTDIYSLARETGFFKGMEVAFSDPDSPHYQQTATVTQSDGPTRTIFFEPPLASPTEAGEQIELYNFKGRGTRIGEYNGAINDAIMIARDVHAVMPLTVVGDELFAATPGVLTIPDEFRSFYGVSFPENDGRTSHVRPQDVKVNRFQRTIEFGRYSASKWNGRYPTFYGYGTPELLEDDDDETSIEAEWLFNEVKAQVLERMVAAGMPVGSQDRLYLQERTEASGKRPLIVTRAMPNTVRSRIE